LRVPFLHTIEDGVLVRGDIYASTEEALEAAGIEE
jgi:hypothetical protein